MIIWIAILILLTVVDQVTKIIVASNYNVGDSTELIEGIFRFTYVQNRGAAFGMLAEHRWVFLLLTTLTIAAIIYYIIKYKPTNKLIMASLTLILSGGIGNMIDRVRLGYVIDFFDFYAFGKAWVWVFNVADACVCVGAGLMVLALLIDTIKESKEKNKAPDEKIAEADEKADDGKQ